MRMQNRRDTYTSWESENPILLSGEIGLDTTYNRYKMGDGITEWNNLNYSSIRIIFNS